jgi:flagellar basal-body rod protein FlgB
VKIGFDAALGPHAEALQLRGQRTEVLARNIAHADTPGYLARDVDFRAELSKRLGGASEGDGLRTTHGRHLASQGLAPDTVTLKYRSPLMASFDGNTVDTQTEQAAFAENNMQFQAALHFVNSKFKGLMGAIKGE